MSNFHPMLPVPIDSTYRWETEVDYKPVTFVQAYRRACAKGCCVTYGLKKEGR